jgi:FtsH-binding integral membrane protein
MFFRKFGTDTTETRRSAARTMVFVYSLIGILGLAFLILSFAGESTQYRTMVQAAIFLVLGAAGLWFNRRGGTRHTQL